MAQELDDGDPSTSAATAPSSTNNNIVLHIVPLTLAKLDDAPLPMRMLAASNPRFATAISPSAPEVVQQFEGQVALMGRFQHRNVMTLAPQKTSGPTAQREVLCLPACRILDQLSHFSSEEVWIGVREVVTAVAHLETVADVALLSLASSHIGVASRLVSVYAGRWLLVDLTNFVPKPTAAPACTAGAVARWLGEDILLTLDASHWAELFDVFGPQCSVPEISDDADAIWMRMASLFKVEAHSCRSHGSARLWAARLAQWVVRAHDALNLPKPAREHHTVAAGSSGTSTDEPATKTPDDQMMPASTTLRCADDDTVPSAVLLSELASLLDDLVAQLPLHTLLHAGESFHASVPTEPSPFASAVASLDALIRSYHDATERRGDPESGHRISNAMLRRVLTWALQPALCAHSEIHSDARDFLRLLVSARRGPASCGDACQREVGRALACIFAEPLLGARDAGVRGGLLSVALPAMELDLLASRLLDPDVTDPNSVLHDMEPPLSLSFLAECVVPECLAATLMCLEAHPLVVVQPPVDPRRPTSPVTFLGAWNSLVKRLGNIPDTPRILDALCVAKAHLDGLRLLLLPFYAASAATGLTLPIAASIQRIRQLVHRAIVPHLSVVVARILRPLAVTAAVPQFLAGAPSDTRDGLRSAIGALTQSSFSFMVDLVSPLGALLVDPSDPSSVAAVATTRAIALSMLPTLLLLPVPPEYRAAMLLECRVVYPLPVSSPIEGNSFRAVAAAALDALAERYGANFATSEVEAPLRTMLPLVATLCAVPSAEIRAAAAVVADEVLTVLREAVASRCVSDDSSVESKPASIPSRSVPPLATLLQRTEPSAALEATPLPSPLWDVVAESSAGLGSTTAAYESHPAGRTLPVCAELPPSSSGIVELPPDDVPRKHLLRVLWTTAECSHFECSTPVASYLPPSLA